MTVRIAGEGEILREASRILIEHLSPAKVVRFWASWQTGHGQYLTWRDEQFGAETVAGLYDKVRAYQERQDAPGAAGSHEQHGSSGA